MAMGISIEVEGDDVVVRRLNRINGRIADMSPGFETVASYMRGVYRHQFDTEGGAGASGGWAPLKDSTVRQKSRRGMDPRILRAYDEMRASFSNKTNSNNVVRIGADEAFFGSKDPKAKHHHHGAPRANVPERRIVDLTERNKRQIVKRMQAFLLDKPVRTTGDV